MKKLGKKPIVLSKASKKAVAVKARNWSEYSHRFLKLCSDSGNIEASYTLGMVCKSMNLINFPILDFHYYCRV